MRFFLPVLLFLLLGLRPVAQATAGKESVALEKKIKHIQALLNNNEQDSAAFLLKELYSFCFASDNHTGLSWYYFLAGGLAKQKGHTDESLRNYQMALLQNEKGEKDPSLFVQTYNEMGTLVSVIGDYQKGIALFLKSYAHTGQIQDIIRREKAVAVVYINLAQLLIGNGDYGKALPYLEKALVLATKNNLFTLITNISMNQGSCYHELGKSKEAMQKYKEALTLCQLHKDPSLEQTLLGNIGNLLIKEGAFPEAIQYFKQALAIDSGSIPYYTVGNIYQLGTGYFYNKEYAKAESNLLKALNMAEKFNLNTHLTEIHYNLSRLYEERKDFPKAHQHLKQYLRINDSISGLEQVKNIQQLEARYQSALKDKTLAENQVLLQRKNNTIFILISLALLALILAYSIFRHKSKLHKRKIKILEQLHEIKAVKSTMETEEKERIRIAQDLHDGIGGMVTALNMKLSRIQKKYAKDSVAVQQDLEQPLSLIQEIASEIRHTSRNLIPETLLHLGLADAIRHYCTYMEESGPIQFDLQFYGHLEKINNSIALSLYRIVQEIAQNIMKHAQATEAVIQIREHKGILNFHAEDNGIGFATKDIETKGRGLANIRSRVEAMKGYFSLSSSGNSGTTIHIEIPIEPEEPSLNES